MGKSILVFVLLTVLFAGGIKAFVEMYSEEKWKLAKVVGYAILCSTIALAVLFVIVAVF